MIVFFSDLPCIVLYSALGFYSLLGCSLSSGFFSSFGSFECFLVPCVDSIIDQTIGVDIDQSDDSFLLVALRGALDLILVEAITSTILLLQGQRARLLGLPHAGLVYRKHLFVVSNLGLFFLMKTVYSCFVVSSGQLVIVEHIADLLLPAELLLPLMRRIVQSCFVSIIERADVGPIPFEKQLVRFIGHHFVMESLVRLEVLSSLHSVV